MLSINISIDFIFWQIIRPKITFQKEYTSIIAQLCRCEWFIFRIKSILKVCWWYSCAYLSNKHHNQSYLSPYHHLWIIFFGTFPLELELFHNNAFMNSHIFTQRNFAEKSFSNNHNQLKIHLKQQQHYQYP